MFCVGACRRSASGRSGALLLFMLVAFAMPTHVEAVCPTCHDFFTGCKGGDQCPLAVEHSANVAAIESGTMTTIPTLKHSLPPEMLVPRQRMRRVAHPVRA